MKYAQLGRSRLEVSRLCLGTMNFARFADTASSHAMLDHALDGGINYIDTANSYGTIGRPSAVEELIGEWIAGDAARRDRIVLATKLYEAREDWPNSGGLSSWSIRRAVEQSLTRLNTDRIDIIQMHHVDRRAHWSEVWEAFDVLRAQGKILYVGSSNFAGWHLASAQYEATMRRSFGLISEQSIYNLAQRSIELEVLPAAEGLGIGVVAWSPLAGGLLASVTDGGRRSNDPAFDSRAKQHEAALQETRTIADGLGVSLGNLAVAWVLSRPGMTSAIVGPRNPDQLRDLLSAPDLQIPDEITARLDAIWPGPGGPAPEAYAW